MTQLPLALSPPEGAVATVGTFHLVPACMNCFKPLSGRQKKFCGDPCRMRWWDIKHPRINRTPPEGPREGSIREAIEAVLADGNWYTAHEIAEAVRAFPHSVSARLAEIRRSMDRVGVWRLESDASNGCSVRAHRFRLVKQL